MKRIAITLIIILEMGLCVSAQESGGTLRRSKEYQATYRNDGINRGGSEGILALPQFGQSGDHDAAPLGNGVALLLGLGAAYLIGSRRMEE